MLQRISLRNETKGVSVSAFTNAYVHDDMRFLHVLSVVGPDSVVKAITSELVSGGTVEIEQEAGRTQPFGLWADQDYTVWSSKLPCGYLHQILLDKRLVSDAIGGNVHFALVAPDEDRNQAIFQLLQRHYSTPILNLWADWLYHRLEEQEHILWLSGKCIKVVRLCVRQSELDEIVSCGVRSGAISLYTEMRMAG